MSGRAREIAREVEADNQEKSRGSDIEAPSHRATSPRGRSIRCLPIESWRGATPRQAPSPPPSQVSRSSAALADATARRVRPMDAAGAMESAENGRHCFQPFPQPRGKEASYPPPPTRRPPSPFPAASAGPAAGARDRHEEKRVADLGVRSPRLSPAPPARAPPPAPEKRRGGGGTAR